MLYSSNIIRIASTSFQPSIVKLACVLTLAMMLNASSFTPVLAAGQTKIVKEEQKAVPKTKTFICGPYSLEVPKDYETVVRSQPYYDSITLNSLLLSKYQKTHDYNVFSAWVSCLRVESPAPKPDANPKHILKSMSYMHLETGRKEGAHLFIRSCNKAVYNSLSCLRYILLSKGYFNKASCELKISKLAAILAYEMPPLPDDKYQTLIFIQPYSHIDYSKSEEIVNQYGEDRYKVAETIMQSIKVLQLKSH